MPNPPLLELLALDPVLGQTKLIAEAWDAGGLYQVGSFPNYGRWAEWNGKFRDCVRKFLKSEMGQVSELSRRLVGSPWLYSGRGSTSSINFITCHDGFTLADLVSYNEKHNLDNGEDNRDGANDNESWNCGTEGPTDNAEILALRRRQVRNALTILLVSQGVPMLSMGDEIGRTQQGNNNAYCQDGPLSWMDWSLAETNADLLRFCQRLIALRAAHPAFRFPMHTGQVAADGSFLEVTWHGTKAWHADWSPESRILASCCGVTAATNRRTSSTLPSIASGKVSASNSPNRKANAAGMWPSIPPCPRRMTPGSLARNRRSMTRPASSWPAAPPSS